MTWEKITKAVAAACGAAAGLLGGWTMLLTILAWFMGIDYATGLIIAWRGRSPKSEHGGVSSRVGFDGLIRKAFIMLVVLMASLLDRTIGNGASVFQTAATMYYIANEGISILENTSLMGVKYPVGLLRALETMRDRADSGEETAEKADRGTFPHGPEG